MKNTTDGFKRNERHNRGKLYTSKKKKMKRYTEKVKMSKGKHNGNIEKTGTREWPTPRTSKKAGFYRDPEALGAREIRLFKG